MYISYFVYFTQIRTQVDPITGCIVPFTPVGRFLHIPPQGPRTDWSSNIGKPWWNDDRYFIGLLSEKTRKVIIMDTLISKEQVIEVIQMFDLYVIVLIHYLCYHTDDKFHLYQNVFSMIEVHISNCLVSVCQIGLNNAPHFVGSCTEMRFQLFYGVFF